ncbi:MAG TPA: peptide ABC transporter substrate-binding protein [Chloroflexota bacterium]|nr:peptide ABC transporter substrate-binding protein [Chloroflexota bacterium]
MKKLGIFLAPALLATIIPWQYAGAATTVLPPNAAPDSQQVLTMPGGSQEGPYLDEDLTIYNRQDGTDLVQDPLVVYDPSTNVLSPVAASSWSVSADKLTWTFHIRHGLVWTDGQPVTSADFATPLRNQAKPKEAPPYDFTYWTKTVMGIKNWAAVNSGKMPVSALGVGNPDPYTLTITTDAPRSYLPAAMVYTWAEPSHIVNKIGNVWATASHFSDMVFSGPYKVQSWQAGVAVTLVRNPMYHGVRKAPFSKIIWKIPGGDLMAQFQTGQVSTTGHLDPGQFALAQHTYPASQIIKNSSYDIWYLTFNTYTKPFNDLRVRQAFDQAINRQTLANNVLKGTAIPNYTLLMPGFPGFDKTITVPYNVTKAQQLLAAAGYPGGKGFPSITIYLRNITGEISMSQPAAEYVQSQIKTNLGINLDVKVIDDKTFTADINQHTEPLFMVGYNYDYVDTSDFMDLFVTGGRHAWSNKQYDQTVGAADHSFDQAARTPLYEKAQKIMAAQVPASFLFVPIYHDLWNAKFVNPYTLPQQTDDWMLKMYVKK